MPFGVETSSIAFLCDGLGVYHIVHNYRIAFIEFNFYKNAFGALCSSLHDEALYQKNTFLLA